MTCYRNWDYDRMKKVCKYESALNSGKKTLIVSLLQLVLEESQILAYANEFSFWK